MMRSTITRKVSAAAVTGLLALGLGACSVKSADGGSGSAGASQGGAGSTAAVSAPPSQDGGGDTAQPGVSSTDMSSDDGSQSSEPSSSAIDSTSDDDSKVAATGKQGEEVEGSYFTAKVDKMTDNVKASDEFETPRAGTRFLSVTVDVKNTASSEFSMADSNLVAKLDDGSEISGGFHTVIGNDLGFKNVARGQQVTGDITFEVPQGKKIKSLSFRPIAIDKATTRESVVVNVG